METDNEGSRDNAGAGGKNAVLVSYFDYSVDNFRAFIDLITELCGLAGDENFDAGELERFSSMITFLREWKFFVYEPKTVNFVYEIGDGQLKDDFDDIILPQFSSAAVPKMEDSLDEARCLKSDFVLNAGGLVWAMDWCPSNLEKLDNSFRCEYLAVAAHPPGSTYHKIGAPLTGRGIIQIWCLLCFDENEEITLKKQRKPRPRGRPKGCSEKKQLNVSKEKEELMVRRPIGRPKGSFKKGQSDDIRGNDEVTARRPRGRPKGSGKKRKRLLLIPHNLNGNMDAELSINNIVPSSSDLIPLLNADLEGNVPDVPVSCALSRNMETLVPKRRGRPSKKQALSVNECIPANENVGTLAVSADLNTSLEPSLPRRRGRPRKKPIESTSECTQAFVVDPEVDVYALTTTRKQGLSGSVELPCTISDSNGHLGSSAECEDGSSALASSREFGPSSENIFLSYAPHDSTGELRSTVPKRRGRPRKKQISNTNVCIAAAAVESEEISALLTSRELGASENMMAICQMDEVVVEEPCEGLNDRLIEINRSPSARSKKQEMNVGCRKMVVFDSDADVNELKDTFMSGNSANLVPTIGVADENVVENDVGPNSCHQKPIKGSTIYRKKKRLKDEARAINHLKMTPSHLSSGCEHNELAITVATDKEYYHSEMIPSKDMVEKKLHIPNDAGLPKVVLCLGHMGKVAWDMKWRPVNVDVLEEKRHLGYLAALLGNGSLEVWEVPLPRMVKILHASCCFDGTDPRFLKLKPMFRCSKVQHGDRQSIPLTLEWSRFAPHDLILAGCHDGTVALWKFAEQQFSQDTKPLLCFSADCVPIRSLAWAPDQSDAESANLIVTAGHEGLKFWDLRDPYRPLWEHNPLQKIILSLEWLNDPRCLLMSYDNGELRMLSLWNVANDVLVTGEPALTTKQPGLHNYPCSDFAIWSIQVSEATGLVAYCTADGSACYFQLTVNAVEKDPSRYREPHFLCGSLATDERVFKIKSSRPNVPLLNIPKKKVPGEMGDALLHTYLTDANQARRGNVSVAGDNQAFPAMKSKSNKKSHNKQSDPERSPKEPAKDIEISEGSGKKLGEFPPKEVAMHKIRWNTNKGSESWLCYGGTAGLIRCQNISKMQRTMAGAKIPQPVCSQIQLYECR